MAEHPTLDALPTLASPLTRLVFAQELGLSYSELDDLEQAGAIVQPPA